MKRFIMGAALIALAGAAGMPVAQAKQIDFTGPLVEVEDDDGTGRYSGREKGDVFFGNIDDTTFAGSISDGAVVTSFDCCDAAASGFNLSNDAMLEDDRLDLLNQLLGTSTFGAGSIFDIVDIEGDTFIDNDNRIEVGLSYILPQDTFASDNPTDTSFDAARAFVTLYFIVEDPYNDGDIIYSAIGQVTAVPWPASVWLMALGVPIVASFARRKTGTR